MGRKSKAAKTAETIAEATESPAQEMAEHGLEVEKKSVGVSTKKKVCGVVRRSGRLQNLVLPTQNQEIQPMVDEIDLFDSEKEDEPRVEEGLPESQPGGKILEEKVDYLLHAVEELKAKACDDGQLPSDSPTKDLRYKTLYIDAQKKIEALKDENYQLCNKLDVALGKMEAYGEASRVYTEALTQLKEVILISNLAKATERAIHLSSDATLAGFSPPNFANEPNAAGERRPQAAKKRKHIQKT